MIFIEAIVKRRQKDFVSGGESLFVELTNEGNYAKISYVAFPIGYATAHNGFSSVLNHPHGESHTKRKGGATHVRSH